MSDLLTEDTFKRCLPKQMHKTVSAEILGYVNDLIIADPETNKDLRDNILSYTSVMKEGRFRLTDYVNAVRYVGFRLEGDNSGMAYAKTFPDRYQRLVNDGVDQRQITCYVRAYKNNILVNKIMARTLVPTHLVNQDVYQEAINTQAELMRNARSETVRMKAADSLLVQLRPPETHKIELDIGISQDPAIDALKETVSKLVQLQRKDIIEGRQSAKQIAHSKIMGEDEIEDAVLIEDDA